MRSIWNRVARFGGRRHGDESGATLVEVLTTVVIMGVVIAPIAVGVKQSLAFVPDSEQRTAAAVYRSIFIDSFADDVASASSVAATANALCTAGATTTFATIERSWSGKQITYKAEVGSDLVGQDQDRYAVTIIRSIKLLPAGTPETLSMLTGYCKAGETIARPTKFIPSTDTTVGQHHQLHVEMSLRDSLANDDPDVFKLGSVVHKTETS